MEVPGRRTKGRHVVLSPSFLASLSCLSVRGLFVFCLSDLLGETEREKDRAREREAETETEGVVGSGGKNMEKWTEKKSLSSFLVTAADFRTSPKASWWLYSGRRNVGPLLRVTDLLERWLRIQN